MKGTHHAGGGNESPSTTERYAKRKAEHINLVINNDVTSHYNYWDDIELVHNALPEINFDDIDTSVKFLDKKINYPLMITGITGGFKGAEKINTELAKIASEFQIGLGVGSERGALISDSLRRSYSCIKDFDVPLKVANIGAPQLVSQKGKKGLSADSIRNLYELIDADLLAIHLNFLQEIVQPEGDLNGQGIFDRIDEISKEYPTIVKETGAGISRSVAERLAKTGIIAIDSSGKGGTSFAKVELYRAKEADTGRYSVGTLFQEWGIPSPVSILYAKRSGKKVVGSGGVRNGTDAARAIALGADIAGIARVALLNLYNPNGADEFFRSFFDSLKASMFLTGSADIAELGKAEYIIKGECSLWPR